MRADESTMPVDGVELRLTHYRTSRIVATTTSGADGAYRFVHVPYGGHDRR